MSDYSKLSNTYLKEDWNVQYPQIVNNQELRSTIDPAYCLTVKDSTSDPVMELCDNSPSQKFNTSLYNIKSVSTGNCLDVKGGSALPGTAVGQWTCGQNKFNQSWAYKNDNILSYVTGTEDRSLDVKMLPTGIKGSGIQIQNISPSTNTKWYPSSDCVLSPSPSTIPYGACSATVCGTTGKKTRPKYTVATPPSGLGKCLNKDEPESIDCRNIDCPVNFMNNQELRSAIDPNYCLTVKDSTSDPVMELCDNSPSQKFNTSEYNIKSVSTGNCLDVKGHKTDPGTVVGQWTCGNKFNQAWTYKNNNILSYVTGTDDRSLDVKMLPTGIKGSGIQIQNISPSTNTKWYPSSNCVLSPSPSTIPYGACSATVCGTTGKKTRPKYTVAVPSSGLGKCLNKDDPESIDCNAPPCPVDCVLTPSGLPYGACSAVGCGTTGKQTRLKYRVERDALYGGKCLNKDEPESIDCNAPACSVVIQPTPSPSQVQVQPTPSPSQVQVQPTPSPSQVQVQPTPSPSQVQVQPTPSPSTEKESFLGKNKWYLIGGGVGLVALIVVLVIINKKSE